MLKRHLPVVSEENSINHVDPSPNDARARQMIHTGVKVFERNSQARSAIEYRVCQEGLELVLPYMTKRVTRCVVVAVAVIRD
ncbi:unnamed protein product, partial [Hapterophycus canaliculatus]